jgi:hypothetical protein
MSRDILDSCRETIAAVLDTAEELLAAGDPEVASLIQIGLFKGIQNVAGGRYELGGNISQEDFEPFLGPRSLAARLEVNFMWGGSTTPDD